MDMTRTKLNYLILAGALVASASLGGIYAAAAGTASFLGSSFTTTAAADHLRSLDFTAEAKRASDEHGADRVKCARLADRKKRNECNAAAKHRNAREL
jgi:hypothetical protein